jgi:hypothetical protein
VVLGRVYSSEVAKQAYVILREAAEPYMTHSKDGSMYSL